VTIKSEKQKRIRDVSKLSSALLACNMGCSRQSLMKLAPLNGKMSASLYLYLRLTFLALVLTFYQVGVLQ